MRGRVGEAGGHLGRSAVLLLAEAQEQLLYIERQGPSRQVGLRERREAPQPGERLLGAHGPSEEPTNLGWTSG